MRMSGRVDACIARLKSESLRAPLACEHFWTVFTLKGLVRLQWSNPMIACVLETYFPFVLTLSVLCKLVYVCFWSSHLTSRWRGSSGPLQYLRARSPQYQLQHHMCRMRSIALIMRCQRGYKVIWFNLIVKFRLFKQAHIDSSARMQISVHPNPNPTRLSMAHM